MSDRDIIAGVVALIDDIGALVDASGNLVSVKPDFLAAQAPAASLQHLPGSRWAKRYVDGSGARETPVMVLLRTSGHDTAGRLDAHAALLLLADEMEATSDGLPDGVTEIRGEGTPVLSERGDDGSEVWRAQFTVVSRRAAPAPAVS
ncbi:MAG: hypothetical protein U1E29_18285 [Coriobacteriia bacterium]|nr:hypothetical protein [Coriobacteriia bacterium]